MTKEQVQDAVELLGVLVYSLIDDRDLKEAQSLKELLLALKTSRKSEKRINAWIPKEK